MSGPFSGIHRNCPFCGNTASVASQTHFFWQDSWNQIANQRSVCNLERTSNGTDETCRLRRGEGLREAPRAQALRRAIGLAERMQSEASLGVCEDEPSETRLRCHRINGSPVNPDKRADVGIGPYRVRCGSTAGGTAAALPHQRQSSANRNAKIPPLRSERRDSASIFYSAAAQMSCTCAPVPESASFSRSAASVCSPPKSIS